MFRQAVVTTSIFKLPSATALDNCLAQTTPEVAVSFFAHVSHIITRFFKNSPVV